MLAGCGNSSVPDTATSQAAATAASAASTSTVASDTSTSTAASAAATSQQNTGEPTTISLWTVFTGSDGDILREIIDNYNSTNKDNIKVNIDIMDNATLQSKLPTAISTGTGPSFVLCGIEYIQQYVKNGMIEDISDFWDKEGVDKSNYLENVVNKSYVDNKLYGVPMQYNLQYLYYNKDLFKAAGLDPNSPPTTMEELEKDAVACTDASKNQYGIGLPVDSTYFIEYLWGNGGDVISEDGTKNLIKSDANINTLKWLQKMELDEKVSPSGLKAADADTMFQSGQLAMYFSGPWNINGLNQLGINYGITAIPAGSAGAFSPEGGCSYMLPKGADDATRAAVYKFMAYWLSDDVLKEWSNRNGFPVWSQTVLKDPDIQSNQILTDVSNASKIGRDWHLNLESGSQIDNDVMVPLIESVLSGNDVEDSVNTASTTLDGIISK
jgi:multiple sugar transport system substrate-binding protein